MFNCLKMQDKIRNSPLPSVSLDERRSHACAQACASARAAGAARQITEEG